MLDNDLTEFIKIRKRGVASILGRYVESMVTTIDNLIKERKRQLLTKAVKDAYPKVYWLAAPTHRDWSAKENNLRNKFNLCLELVVRQIDSMRIIRMKEIWSGNDTTLVKNDEISLDGLAKYWLSVDGTIKFNVQQAELYQNPKTWKKDKKRKSSLGSQTCEDQHSSDEEYVKSDRKDQMQEFFARKRRRSDQYHWKRTTTPDRSNDRLLMPRPPKAK